MSSTHDHHLTRRASLGVLAASLGSAALAKAQPKDQQKDQQKDQPKDQPSAQPATPQPASANPSAQAMPSAPAPKQGAGFYRFNVGDLECYSIAEGGMPGQGSAYPTFGKNATQDAVDRLTADNFIPAAGGYSYFNILAVKTKDALLLVDPGFGTLAGERGGWLLDNMKSAGLDPASVTHVVLTHLHPDHVGLLHTLGGTPFPRARYFISEAEERFWSANAPDLSRMGVDDQMRATMTSVAKGAMDNVSAKLVATANDDQLIPGVRVRHTPGHTPGHQLVHLASGNDELLHIVDIAHHFAISFQRPGWHVAFDTDPEQGANMRRKVLAQAAADRTRIFSYHTPWPALGRVVEHTPFDNQPTFAWTPEPWRW